ncbi:MAG: site-specific integrase [Solirubrobacterales bacterium]|nr:site-specific integrase [Solirubrobacterales bacterium]
MAEMVSASRRGSLEGSNISSGKTFGDACAEWLRYERDDKQIALSTYRSYVNVVGGIKPNGERHGRLIPEFGAETSLDSIDTDRIELFREQMLESGELSRRTIQLHLALLHGIFKRATRKKWIKSNPSSDVERVTFKSSGDFTVLTPAEVAAVSRAASSEQMSTMFTVAGFTGLRLGELRALRWADVNFTDRMIMVRRNHPNGGVERVPKSGKVRSVPMIDQAARALDALSRRPMFVETGDRVFPSATGGVLDDVPIRREFYAALKAAGLGHLRDKSVPIVFHDLRHTFGTLAAGLWPLFEVQGYMGHADIQTTMIYVHHVPKVEAAGELSRVVEASMGVEISAPSSTSSGFAPNPS